MTVQSQYKNTDGARNNKLNKKRLITWKKKQEKKGV